jgi:tetratricopeptide (TPR) repeat protein
MIISGMLLAIAAGEEKSEWLNYYRHFVIAARPSIMDELTGAAVIKARSGDFDLALEILDTLRGLFPSSPAVTLNRALVMEERASALEKREGSRTASAAIEAVEAAYSQARYQYPDFPDIQFNAGFFYLNRNDFRRARECFSLYINSAENEAKREQAQAVIRDIEKNSLEDERFGGACRLIQQGNEEEGMECIRDFIEEHPAVWNGWFILGWALRRLGRWENAAAVFGKAIELGGNNSDTRNELAICLMESGDLKGARRELEAALYDDPENVKIISNMGVLALKNGNATEAAAFFRTVLELDSEDPIAKNFFG